MDPITRLYGETFKKDLWEKEKDTLKKYCDQLQLDLADQATDSILNRVNEMTKALAEHLPKLSAKEQEEVGALFSAVKIIFETEGGKGLFGMTAKSIATHIESSKRAIFNKKGNSRLNV